MTQRRLIRWWLLAVPLFVTPSCVPSISATITASPSSSVRLAYDLAALDFEPVPTAGSAAARRERIVAAPPFVPPTRDSRQLARAADCLTAAVYHEARSEGEDGQRAVAQVVLNRVRHFAFPSTICGVVYQGSHRRTGCQFSFTCDGSLLRRRDAHAWTLAYRIAGEALGGRVYSPVGLATHYHTMRVQPSWGWSLERLGTVGVHVFYRWPGAAGRPAAFVRRSSSLEQVVGPRALASSRLDSSAMHASGGGTATMAMVESIEDAQPAAPATSTAAGPAATSAAPSHQRKSPGFATLDESEL